jgi:hypothetical protein
MNRNGLAFRAACTGLIPLVFMVDFSGCATSARASQDLGPAPHLSADRTAVRELGLVALHVGTEVELLMRGDSRIHGEFRGVERMSAERYAMHVDSVWASVAPESRPPAPGARVTIHPRRGKQWTGQLIGYAFRGLEVLRDDRHVPVLVRFDQLSELSGEGDRVWTPAALDQEAAAGRLPAFSELVVRTYGEAQRIPLDRVLFVSYRTSSGHWVAGAIVGGVLGAVLVLYLIGHSMSHASQRCAGPTPVVSGW